MKKLNFSPKIKSLKHIFGISLLMLIILSCDKDDEKIDEFIYPLSVGNNWEYSRHWGLYFYPDSTV